MSNVLNFPSKSDGLVVPNKPDLVDSSGQEVKSPRSIQNEIIQRRNFLLLDCVTGDSIVSNGNAVQALQALGLFYPQLLIKSMEQVAFGVSNYVVKNQDKIVAASEKTEQPTESPVQPESGNE